MQHADVFESCRVEVTVLSMGSVCQLKLGNTTIMNEHSYLA